MTFTRRRLIGSTLGTTVGLSLGFPGLLHAADAVQRGGTLVVNL
ncbi:MAG: hypothetical protein JWQ73_3109, partial [Variovorax sp.]|nr:hypothetical protein [Variovorax sp.]